MGAGWVRYFPESLPRRFSGRSLDGVSTGRGSGCRPPHAGKGQRGRLTSGPISESAPAGSGVEKTSLFGGSGEGDLAVIGTSCCAVSNDYGTQGQPAARALRQYSHDDVSDGISDRVVDGF